MCHRHEDLNILQYKKRMAYDVLYGDLCPTVLQILVNGTCFKVHVEMEDGKNERDQSDLLIQQK